ncbi:hypothetical protein HU200_046498 [Digitaria exilis]|uniref:Sodium/calcium exchanger membrane region domain-containing protein n=1 Tax=Digitaria exilis TaxID=1010633 RepID=A0A835AY21_9POAL|nr:hypothetical protein HU200_046498 [Digitaria exilis]
MLLSFISSCRTVAAEMKLVRVEMEIKGMTTPNMHILQFPNGKPLLGLQFSLHGYQFSLGFLVDAIEGASKHCKTSLAFMSFVLLLIVGNAAEHASAVMFAMKDKLYISLGVAVGSSTQISMFVVGYSIVTGWMMGQPMDLNFHLFEIANLLITVLVVAFLLQDGTSNCFKGLMLILCYLTVAASFYVYADPNINGKVPHLSKSLFV